MAHRINSEGLTLIKNSEGLRLNAYYDSVGVLTIGYGTTNACKDVIGTIITPAMQISKDTASLWLEKSINAKYMPKVDKYDSTYHWNNNEASALCSFAYNIGSIDQLTNYGKRSKAEIAEKMMAYNKAGGRVLAGLTTRRAKEKALFLKKDSAVHNDGIAVPTVKNGTRGENAKALQRNLNKDLGCGLKEDGIIGPLSVSQIKEFQKKHGLVQDGIYGKLSYAAMQQALKEV